MNPQKLLEVIERYERILQELDYKPAQLPTSNYVDGKYKGFNHALWMMEEAKKLVAQGELDKAFRWVCFVQGVLWMGGECYVDSFREDNQGILIVP
jgi:hypothetical protein